MSAEIHFSLFLFGVATMSHIELTTGDLEAILRQHHIPAREWGEWSALVYQGQRPGTTLLAHLRQGNRGAAFRHILKDLSEAYWRKMGIKFPPKQTAMRKAS